MPLQRVYDKVLVAGGEPDSWYWRPLDRLLCPTLFLHSARARAGQHSGIQQQQQRRARKPAAAAAACVATQAAQRPQPWRRPPRNRRQVDAAAAADARRSRKPQHTAAVHTQHLTRQSTSMGDAAPALSRFCRLSGVQHRLRLNRCITFVMAAADPTRIHADARIAHRPQTEIGRLLPSCRVPMLPSG